MLETNTIYQCDVLDGLGMLDDCSIDLIITSPPYNKTALNGNINRSTRRWNTSISYNGDAKNDMMDEAEYQEWQIKVLEECHRVLKNDGSMFYNHKNRIVYGTGEIISPYKWLLKTPFMGSGTVAVSAIKNGCDYIGFEKYKEYIDMANEKIDCIS